MFSFTGILIREEESYSALCPELDVASAGEPVEEAQATLLEAATLHLEGAFEDGLLYLRPVPAAVDPRHTVPANMVQVFRFKVDVAVHAYA